MKITLRILISLSLFGSLGLFSQVKSYELVGTLKTDGDVLVPLQLNIEIDPSGVVSGNSISNFYSEDRTESRISGRMDFTKQKLSFEEVTNVSTNSKAAEDEFCYIRVTNLPFKKSQTKTIFNGSFIGYYPDSTTCAEGEIYLVSMELVEQFVNNNPEISRVKDSLQRFSPTDPNNQNELENQVDLKKPLENKTQAYIPWTGNEIKISIWDNYEEDNDRFDVYVNDSLVHDSEVATARKKYYRFPFQSTRCSIKIVAENEGRRPPNTFQAELIDKGKVRNVETKLKEGEYVIFTFIKENE